MILLGCGTVGGSLVRLLQGHRDHVRRRWGVEFLLSRVLVRDLSKPRPGVPRSLLTRCAEEALASPGEVVVEVIGGIQPPRSLVERALEMGRYVVTANKALLARYGVELHRLARERGVGIGFEASVCGGLPIVRVLTEGLAGDRVRSLTGILNGTCNYVLTRMAKEGLSLDEAVRRAQELGFAESDPYMDLSGKDSAQKLLILSGLAFGEAVLEEAVAVEGILGMDGERVRRAYAEGRAVKLVARARMSSGRLELRVGPEFLPLSHPLARVDDEYNAVIIEGEGCGEILLCGRGAGGVPTASAVLADLIQFAVDGVGRGGMVCWAFNQ